MSIVTPAIIAPLASWYMIGLLIKVRATEQSLQRESAKNLALLRNASDGIHILDFEGNILEVSDAFCSMVGYRRDELLGMNVTQWDVGFASPEAILASVKWQFNKQARSQFETRHRRKDGSIFDVEVSGLPMELDGKQVLFNSSRDISGRILDERNLRESRDALAEQENALRTLVENTPDTIARYDRQCRRIFVNAALALQFGRSAEAILYKTPAETSIDSVGMDDYLDRVRSVFENGQPETYLLEWKNASGHQCYSDIRLIPERDGEGNIVSVLGIGTNITERKQAELLVKENENRYRNLINSAPFPIVVTDGETSALHYANPQAERIFGGQTKDFVGRMTSDFFVDPEVHKTVRSQGIELLRAGNKSFTYEAELHDLEGRRFWAMLSIALIDFDGRPALLTSINDISDRKKAELILADSESRYRSLVEAAPFPVIVVNIDSGELMFGNAPAARLFGFELHETVGVKSVTAYANPADREKLINLLKQGIPVRDVELQLLKHDGTPFWVVASVSLVEFDGKLASLSSLTDITDRKKAEADLRIAATAFETQEGMLVTDAQGDILRVNQAFTVITGYSAEEVIGKNPRLFHSGMHDPDFYEDMWKSISGHDSWEGEIWNRRKNGEVFPEHLTITAVKNADGVITNYVANLTDITLNKAAAEKIERLAFYDPLTKLPNRRLMLDRLQQALASSTRSGRSGALLFLDLDHFKVLNDTRGHDAGDLLLQLVAERLTACVREDDTVSRLGGDEFVVMLEDLSDQTLEAATQAESIGHKILNELNRPYQINQYSHHSTPSIGITLFNDHEHSIEELLKQADIAMYQAKKAGRNALRFFDPLMQENINARASLEIELREALNKQQFQLYYQIQVDNYGHAVGAEALIRWIHPKRGMVSPAQFIPLAEETGLIVPIGQWVLETACAQLEVWQQQALTRDLVLSVNVSARQFHQPYFASQVRDALRGYTIEPFRLKLELTESLLLQNVDDTIATMNALNALGVQFSLDDFGTGYSSLQYLKRLPLDQLKIDQTFVRDIVNDTNDEAIVRTIIAMAQSLDLHYIAEGVETEKQKHVLLNNGCIHFQGYLFGKPVPLAEFEQSLIQPHDQELSDV